MKNLLSNISLIQYLELIPPISKIVQDNKTVKRRVLKLTELGYEVTSKHYESSAVGYIVEVESIKYYCFGRVKNRIQLVRLKLETVPQY